MSSDGCVALPLGAIVCLHFVIVVYPDQTNLLFFDLDCGMLHDLIKAYI